MFDMVHALNSLKGELARVNRALGVMEAMAAERYQKRRNNAMKTAAEFNGACQTGAARNAFVPPQRLDPDAALWR